ncbi:unnamed protein product [Urochloa decumbens]|uniref:Uncharacterized protein n=1 Tax=Urochloa decumbens TaxID=240449 RepID=A0ABC9BCF6_9POAL
MRVSGVGLVTILVLVVFGGVLVVPAHCRSPQLFKTESTKATTTGTNYSTSVDESKIYLIFCVKGLCATATTRGLGLCFCCQNSPNACYNSFSECQANCPSCNPKCHLQSSAGSSVIASHSSNANAKGTLF